MRFLGSKYAKNAFADGATPDPAGGAYSSPPDSLAGLGIRFAAGRGGEGIGGQGPLKLCIPGSFFSPQSTPVCVISIYSDEKLSTDLNSSTLNPHNNR